MPLPARGRAQWGTSLETKSAHLARLARTLQPHPTQQVVSPVLQAAFSQEEPRIGASGVHLALHSPAVGRQHVQCVQAARTRDNQDSPRACRAPPGSPSQRIVLLVKV